MLWEREAVWRLRLFVFMYFMSLPLTWSSSGRSTWKCFKEYVTYSLILCGLMVIMVVLVVVASGCQQPWTYKTVAF